MDFVAIDFETANEQQIPCAIGITVVENNEIKVCRSYLINPESHFSDTNIRIHGIRPQDVEGAPTFPELWREIGVYLYHHPIAAHNAAFDLSVLCKSLARYNIAVPIFTYYCTYQISRDAFPRMEKHTLDFVCNSLNIQLVHHSCGSDALACAKILLYFSNNCPNYISSNQYDFSSRSSEYHFRHSHPCAKNMKPGNAAFDDTSALICFPGKNFVVTGEFKNFSRSEIKEYIASRGGIVKSTVSKRTDYLIVGEVNTNVVKDKENAKSTKIITAEKIERETGKDILILSEEQFLRLQPPCADTDPVSV